jgi:hypothetical protein
VENTDRTKEYSRSHCLLSNYFPNIFNFEHFAPQSTLVQQLTDRIDGSIVILHALA